MIVIKATCVLCNEDSEMLSYELHLTIFTHGQGHFYEFLCKNCHQASKNYCDEVIASLLVDRGRVPATFIDVSPEFLEREQNAPPLTYDDLLDFHNELEALDSL